MTPYVAPNFCVLQTRIPVNLHPLGVWEYALHLLWTSSFVKRMSKKPKTYTSFVKGYRSPTSLSQKGICKSISKTIYVSIKVSKNIKNLYIKILKNHFLEININRKRIILIDQNQQPRPQGIPTSTQLHPFQQPDPTPTWGLPAMLVTPSPHSPIWPQAIPPQAAAPTGSPIERSQPIPVLGLGRH